MKVGPVLRALEGQADVELVHTGQHYDRAMSEQFFADLGLPEPDVNLGVGSGSHAEQTAGVMVAFERHLERSRPDAVVVVGDVNSTVACAVTAVKLHVPVAHVEAGLRSGDWHMPEEVNRVLTDRISRWLFTPSEDADRNLLAEGIDEGWVHRVGNVMIDTLLANLPRASERAESVRRRIGLADEPYGLVTLHRPSNVDELTELKLLLDSLDEIGSDVPLVFPVHPRTRERLDEGGTTLPGSIRFVEPMGYLDFVSLMQQASLVLTDSGGIQEETSVLGVPCVTVRDSTERPITCTMGTNTLAGTDPHRVRAAAKQALSRAWQPADIPLWDGKSGQRIAEILLRDLM